MSTRQPHLARLRTRWSAIGAAVAVSLGAGGIGLANASIGTGDKPVTITISPERVLDTRADLGLAGRFADATPRELKVTGMVPVAPSGMKTVVPDDASAVLVNITVVRPSHNGFLSLRPGGVTGEPATSTVNFDPSTIEPNAATVDIGPDGTVQIWVETSSDSGNAHVLLDIVGYTIDHHHDDRYYTEAEADAVHATKANSADVYTKAEVDAAVAELAKSQARVIENRVNSDVSVSDPGKTVSSVAVSTTSGQTASVTVFSTMNAFDSDVVQCSISTTEALDGDYLQLPAAGRDQLSGHRTFELGENASATYYLFCTDSAATSVLEDIVLTAIVIPTATP